MNNIYLHAIYAYYRKYDHERTVKILKKILESDAILSRRLQNKNSTYGFNGLDYISLCDYDKVNEQSKKISNHTAFDQHIKKSLSLMFPKDRITVIEPQLVDYVGISDNEVKKMKELGLSQNQRYSDLFDEVQVKDRVPLEVMNGVTVPLYEMVKGYFIGPVASNITLRELEEIRELLIKHNHEVPIYDIESFISLDDEQQAKSLIKRYTKRFF